MTSWAWGVGWTSESWVGSYVVVCTAIVLLPVSWITLTAVPWLPMLSWAV
jgi:hypothetical protein